MNKNILSFGELASTRLKESVDDLELFTLFLTLMNTTDDIKVGYSTTPTTLLFDQKTLGFTVMFDDEQHGEIELDFHCKLIDDDLSKSLSYDPFFVDLSYSTDVNVTHLNKTKILAVLDAIAGFYVDPTRPFNWLIDKSHFDEYTTIEQASQQFLTVLKDYFYLDLGHQKPKLSLVVNH